MPLTFLLSYAQTTNEGKKLKKWTGTAQKKLVSCGFIRNTGGFESLKNDS